MMKMRWGMELGCL